MKAFVVPVVSSQQIHHVKQMLLPGRLVPELEAVGCWAGHSPAGEGITGSENCWVAWAGLSMAEPVCPSLLSLLQMGTKAWSS